MKSKYLGLRLSSGLHDILTKIADADRRDMSSLVRIIIEDWLVFSQIIVETEEGAVNRDCVVCGMQFSARNGYQKTCSPQCSRENGKRLSRAWKGPHKPLTPEQKRRNRVAQRIREEKHMVALKALKELGIKI